MTVTVEGTPLDIITASARLAERAGATAWELVWDCPHLPDVDPDDHTCEAVEWHAVATYRGARITESARNPHEAALALSVRLMDGAACRCGRDVTLSQHSSKARCQWRLDGDRWQPGCDADPLTIATRGDYNGMVSALGNGNRAQRRAAARLAKRNPRGN